MHGLHISALSGRKFQCVDMNMRTGLAFAQLSHCVCFHMCVVVHMSPLGGCELD